MNNWTSGRYAALKTKGVVSIQSLVVSQRSAAGGCRNIGYFRENPGTLEPGTLEFDISHLPSGIYFLRVYAGRQMIVKKIIKL
ncbi:MAG: T9SS type A sorting domain-containing protein [Bacteroidales bacterium]|nr:T9SS type A sorting domain-containing protein [Bacteroidales bacterium]